MGGIVAGDNDLSFYIHNLAEQSLFCEFDVVSNVNTCYY